MIFSVDSHVRERTSPTNVKQASATLTAVPTFAERLKNARARAGLSQVELAQRAKLSAGAIGNYESGTREAPRELFGLAAALGVNPEWLATGRGAKNPELPTRHAQPLSLEHLTLTAHEVEWRSLMEGPLPKTFKVAAPDDSMAPRLRTGQLVEFETGIEPRPGDGVLVTDAEGEPYIRLYRQGRQGRWEAHAENGAYQTLDSERDGLKVLAVLVSVHARWG